MKSFLFIAISCSLTLACSIKEENKSLTDQYNLELNGCSTGEHSFSAKSEDELKRQYCETLKNDSANKYCASSMRYDLFKSKCQGYSWN